MSENLQAFLTTLEGWPAHQVMTDASECMAYAYDNSRRVACPDAVFFPESEDDVIKAVRACNQHHIPIVARGRGTGTPGGAVPTEGGLVLSFERMNAIINIEPENRLAIVQPGVTNAELQNAAAQQGFFWPPDPSSSEYCTIGGNLAYNSAGPRAVKYGTPRENTLGLRVVTGEGKVVKLGVKTSKGVVGYDLTRLFIGSEGTLGIITEATLKLTPLAENKRTFRAFYKSPEAAADGVAQIMASAITPSALELMDDTAITLVKSFSSVEIPDAATAILMVEIDGCEASLEQEAKAIKQAAAHDQLISLDEATTQEEAKHLWATRKALSPAQRKVAPNKINEDVVVPVSQLPKLMTSVQTISKRLDITILCFGHAGNGNLHVNILFDKTDPKQDAAANTALEQIFETVLSLDGTLSGEHGVGLDKMPFIHQELGEAELHLMQSIKRAFDPKNILNPGKIFAMSK